MCHEDCESSAIRYTKPFFMCCDVDGAWYAQYDKIDIV